MTVTLAFYKGNGGTRWQRFIDWAIRFATGGPYSHVELIAGPAELGKAYRCLSSSARDGGVRAKRIMLAPDHWDLAALNIDPAEPVRFILDRAGARYDLRGIFLSHLLAFGGHDPDKWFCSEIIAAALGLEHPQRISPNLLWEFVTWPARVRA